MKKSLLLFFIITVTAFGFKRYSFALFSPEKYHCIQTGFLSDDYCNSIKDNVHALLDKKCSAHNLITELKKEYPLLDKIKIAYRPCGTYVMLYAHQPLCRINSNLVLADNNELYPYDFFAPHITHECAHITVAQDYISKVSSLVPNLLNGLSAQHHETYNFELLHEHCVYLIDKQDPNFTIIASVGQKKMSTLIAHCISVKKVIRDQKNSHTSHWMMDMRFSDYIVAYRA